MPIDLVRPVERTATTEKVRAVYDWGDSLRNRVWNMETQRKVTSARLLDRLFGQADIASAPSSPPARAGHTAPTPGVENGLLGGLLDTEA
ncbi:hypothetical protein QWZ03_01800 [Chitinimonas viridis]|uniref:Uncharacterized protein n=1 Tax=Chitinimonas viridis TaxID=664880 RepID=A0ABT8B1Y7_9NEIS|nr:hypothetical protein [Chitinimonas viridis]MDN3575504.1 hypothetical protein [Chitinimonas viridis]